jgi:succinate---hydroxymethylglutarate CoA-transferase
MLRFIRRRTKQAFRSALQIFFEKDHDMKKPLSGVRVLDFTRMFAGPFCTMLLADLGADVVKLEPPEGDPTRIQGPPFFEGSGMSFLAANRNKRSITLDLKSPSDLATARHLAQRADVIVENFRPDVMKKFSLDYETLRPGNPRLIYMAMSGMGASGPYSRKGALDLTIQAEGGYMSLTGERDGEPIKLGTSAFDLVCGQYASSGIVTALYDREKTGRGQKIETSLFEGILTYLVDAGMGWLLTGERRPKWGSEHASNVPYKAFRAADGWIVIASATQRLYEAFMKVLRRPDLVTDPRFVAMADRVKNRLALYEILDAEVLTWKVSDLVAALDEGQVPCAPVNDMEQVFKHPQTIARGMLASVKHRDGRETPAIGPALKFSAFDIAADWQAPPALGEHQDEVLREWLEAKPVEAAI